jgi:hypothetical protein
VASPAVVCRTGQYITGQIANGAPGGPTITEFTSGATAITDGSAGSAGVYDTPACNISNLQLASVGGAGSVGILLDHTAKAHLSNLRIDSFETAIRYRDSIVLQLTGFYSVQSTTCLLGVDDDTYGLYGAQINDFDCENATAQAILVPRALGWHIHDSTFQGVGHSGSGLGIVSFTDCAIATGVASCVLLDNNHFESNVGLADVDINCANTTVPATVNNNTFVSTTVSSNLRIAGCNLMVFANGWSSTGSPVGAVFTSTTAGRYWANSAGSTITNAGAATSP